jgi:hypothetical protein
LAASRDYDKNDLIPKDDLELIQKINDHPDFGSQSAKKIKSRFFQIKRQCLKVVLETVDEEYYKKASLSGNKFEKIYVGADSREKAVSASYDLRSSFLHSGSADDSISEDWYKSNFRNIRENIKNNNLKQSLNLYQLSCLLQNCISNCLKDELLIPEKLAKLPPKVSLLDELK